MKNIQNYWQRSRLDLFFLYPSNNIELSSLLSLCQIKKPTRVNTPVVKQVWVTLKSKNTKNSISKQKGKGYPPPEHSKNYISLSTLILFGEREWLSMWSRSKNSTSDPNYSDKLAKEAMEDVSCHKYFKEYQTCMKKRGNQLQKCYPLLKMYNGCM